MARPTIKALCGFDTSTLIGKPIEEASKEIVNALLEKKKELATELNEVHKTRKYGYDYVSTINTKIMYIDKAIEARTQDYDEMMFGTDEEPEALQFKDFGQSKKHSHYEITANQIAGIIIGWCLVYFVFPIMGIEPTVTQASISSAMFFVGSYIRAYTIRRIFNNLDFFIEKLRSINVFRKISNKLKG